MFDLESVRPVMASHPYKLDVEGENILVFIFENILLPDSNRTVEGSKGYAIFNINLKPNLPMAQSSAIKLQFILITMPQLSLMRQ